MDIINLEKKLCFFSKLNDQIKKIEKTKFLYIPIFYYNNYYIFCSQG